MENVEIARAFNEYADLLEIQGQNPFRVRSYRKAAMTVEGLSRPVIELLDEGEDLTELPGIGARMVEHIREIIARGRLAGLQEIQKDLPGTLTEVMHLPGLGPKRTKQLHDVLGIRSIQQLRKALDAGKVEKLRGFGEKSAEKIRLGIKEFAQQARRFKLSDADQLVRPLVAYLRQAPGIEQMEVAGSYRRRKETVGDVDILVASEKPRPVMARFRTYPDVKRVEMAGPTRGTIVLRSGLQVDLRIVPHRSYGAALHYFTGSKAHNVAVRTLGVERGLRISEYGVFRVPKRKKADGLGKEEGVRIGGAQEEDVFRAVGMQWIPPELREDRGEIAAAQQKKLPELLTLDDIRGDLHMHSTWTDGNSTIEEMVRACQERGYQYCAITDHSQESRVAGGLGVKDFKKQWKEIEKARKQFPKIQVLAGVELDILADGSLDLPDKTLGGFDIVIAAIHSNLNITKQQMTKRILRALAHPAVDILAHPTGRQINRREPFSVDLEQVFKAAKQHDVALELNAQPERLDLNDANVRWARELSIKIAIGTDAHSTGNLRYMRYGVDQARRGWLEKRHVLNTMTWRQLQAWLDRRRS
ncbi:MAG: DNA polymerase/3'-5' exonuclease PolX [Acidobacteria bacterium]|nr:DNA polymerase/3'-5' exonuclease PolX [Acidobacteriota bacterium]